MKMFALLVLLVMVALPTQSHDRDGTRSSMIHHTRLNWNIRERGLLDASCAGGGSACTDCIPVGGASGSVFRRCDTWSNSNAHFAIQDMLLAQYGSAAFSGVAVKEVGCTANRVNFWDLTDDYSVELHHWLENVTPGSLPTPGGQVDTIAVTFEGDQLQLGPFCYGSVVPSTVANCGQRLHIMLPRNTVGLSMRIQDADAGYDIPSDDNLHEYRCWVDLWYLGP